MTVESNYAIARLSVGLKSHVIFATHQKQNQSPSYTRDFPALWASYR